MLIIIDKEWSIKDKGGSYLLTRWEGKTNIIKASGDITKVYTHKSHHGSLADCLATYARYVVLDSTDQMTLDGYVKALEIAYRMEPGELDFKNEYIELTKKYNDLAGNYIDLTKKLIKYQEDDINFSQIHISVVDNQSLSIEKDMLYGNITRIMLTSDVEELEKMKLFALVRLNTICNYRRYCISSPF